MVATPQTFERATAKFVKKTGFAMEQFFGRVWGTIQLPDELPREDLIAVARIHFPEVSAEQIELVADLAELSENYLQTVDAVAKRARYIARREGHRRITVSDLETAAFEVFPRGPAPAPDSAPPNARPLAAKGRISGAAEQPLKAPLKALARGMQPGRMQPIEVGSLPSLSSRGAGLESTEADLVPAEA